MLAQDLLLIHISDLGLEVGFDIALIPDALSRLAAISSGIGGVWSILILMILGLCGTTGGLVFAAIRRRVATREVAAAMFRPPASAIVQLEVGIEEAERELAILYRRMAAYLRDPYDFAGSRIRDEDGFGRNLDFAVALNLRISTVGSGATQIDSDEQSRTRQQILQAIVCRVDRQQTGALSQSRRHYAQLEKSQLEQSPSWQRHTQ